MNRNGRLTAEFVIADAGCWVRIRTRAAFQAVPDRGWNPARYLGDDMVLAGLGELRPTTMHDAFGDLLDAGLQVLGRAGRKVATLNFVHPSHWGVRRVQQLQSLAQARGYSVICTPFATAVCQRQPAPNGGVTVVLEAGELTTCATVVSADGSMLECRFEPDLGTADLAAGDVTPRFAALVNRAGIDRVVVAGAPGEELDRIERVTSATSVAADAHGLVAPKARVRTVSLPDRLASVHRGWLLVAAAVVAAIVVAGMFAMLYGSGRGPATEATPIRFGRLEVTVPQGWMWQEGEPADPRQEQIDLTDANFDDREIIVMQNSVPDGTTLEDAKRTLEILVSTRTNFSALENAVFAGRQTIHFTERLRKDSSEVHWYMLIDREIQISVGCQFRPGVWEALSAACEQVVGSVEVVD